MKSLDLEKIPLARQTDLPSSGPGRNLCEAPFFNLKVLSINQCAMD
jgi:hypothetical protein